MMQLCKVRLDTGEERVGLVQPDGIHLLATRAERGSRLLSDILHGNDPARAVRDLLDSQARPLPADRAALLPPVDQQEVWAAGVTYLRSREARERESVGAAQFYDKVYTAPRPELFFKATAARVVGPSQAVRIRQDSRWTVPEPELALVLAPDLRLVGFTIGNDMSARDIEGENPLYLPQAKVYDQACALGPVITLAAAMPPLAEVTIRLLIERQGQTVFDSSTAVSRMARTLDTLIDWLGRDNSFPQGVVLLTGTGVVPADDFSLQAGDAVHIDIAGIGRLSNPVLKA